jgi:hypothetical protein
MHSTKATSSAGQLKGCTSFGASISSATETPILTISHSMKLAALLPGDMLDNRLVMPRAINRPGSTTTAAPYSADSPVIGLPVKSHTKAATTTPSPACTATTRQGEIVGSLERRACASCGVSAFEGALPQCSSFSSVQGSEAVLRVARSFIRTFNASFRRANLKIIRGNPMQLLRSRSGPLFAAAALVVLTSGCSTAAQTTDTSQPHHRSGGYQNNHIEFAPKGVLRLLEWKAQAMAAGLPKPPTTPTATVAPELDFIHANAKAGAAMQPAVTWIGHATALVQAGGVNVLTDPVFAERASPLDFLGPKRAQPPGVAIAKLPRIDLVVISHNHYDHFDLASVRALARSK